MRTLVTLALTMTVVVGLAGCGGSSSDSDPTPPATASTPAATTPEDPAPAAEAPTDTVKDDAPTHDEFISALNAICRKANGQVATLQEEGERADSSGDYDGLAEIVVRRNEIAADLLPDLQALAAPPEDAKAFAKYLTAIEQQEGTTKRLVSALRDRDDHAIQTLSGLLDKTASAKG